MTDAAPKINIGVTGSNCPGDGGSLILGHERVAGAVRRRDADSKRYWAFRCRPDWYDCQAAVKDGFDNWYVSRSKPEPGDEALIWQTKDRDGRRGVIAFCDVLTHADPNLADNSPRRHVPPIEGPRVGIRYTGAPRRACLFTDEQMPAELLSLTAATASQGTVFRMSREQWDAVVNLASGIEAVPVSVMQAVLAETESLARGSGQVCASIRDAHGGRGLRYEPHA